MFWRVTLLEQFSLLSANQTIPVPLSSLLILHSGHNFQFRFASWFLTVPSSLQRTHALHLRKTVKCCTSFFLLATLERRFIIYLFKQFFIGIEAG